MNIIIKSIINIVINNIIFKIDIFLIHLLFSILFESSRHNLYVLSFSSIYKSPYISDSEIHFPF
jgi:hypothetical protein